MKRVVSVMTASSKSGGACVSELLTRYSKDVDVRAVFRTDGAADVLRHMETDVDIVVGPDADEVSSLDPAFDGADVAVIVTPHRPTAKDMSHDAELSNNMVRAAVRAGVEHIVYIGSWTVHYPDAMPMLASRFTPTEELLGCVDPSVATWTSFRSGYFSNNTAAWKPAIKRMNAVAFPDVHIPIVDPRDIGRAAAAVAASENPGAEHGGKLYEGSGPEMLSLADFAKVFTEVLGREIQAQPADLDKTCSVVPPYFAEVLRHMDAKGDSAVPISDDIARLTGSHTTFRQWLEEHKGLFE